ncbi:alpha/beta hydrolase family protein [Nocardia farcinica]|uniref:PE-PPE domain-containing protein n=1 Tax=Nocardia farcinica TaxID=37329 RepID=UPI0018944B75|nr:PE-PPE domain-containing protein [Nocardia farcinica]MBF6410990.1 PE-PPE domain-containing protein [Nocardia farcinica]
MTVDVIWLSGTGYGAQPDGVSAAFAAALPDGFGFVPVRYPASYIHPVSYAESVRRGREAVIDAIRATPARVVVGGYSQGARIAGDLAAEIGRGLHPDLEVEGCALIADPLRPVGAGMPGRPVASGYGISGQRFITDIPAWWAAVEGDPITALPAGNPLRSVADVTEYMTLSDPVSAQRWGEDLLRRAVEGRWQRWWSPANWRSWGGAIAYARGYLVDGRHTADYVLYGHAAHLARIVAEEVQ